MDVLFGLLQSVTPKKDTDTADRCSYVYTTMLLAICAGFVTGWSFFGHVIHCWFPQYYTGFWQQYALDYCFVQNTYFLPFTEVTPVGNYQEQARELVHIPKNITERDQRLIGYYQWVPVILALQAILFYLPLVFWRSAYEMATIRVEAICTSAANAKDMDSDGRRQAMVHVGRFMSARIWLNNEKDEVGLCARLLSGRQAICAYLLTKLLFTLNVLAQFLLLNYFLGVHNIFWGWSLIRSLLNNRLWETSGNFPRVTLCDFEVRVLGNLHRHTVQCVLMINMFNEKIFVLLWWWFLIVTIISISSLFYWTATSLSKRYMETTMLKYMEKNGLSWQSARMKPLLSQFLNDGLRPDGVFLLRLIAHNGGHAVAADLLDVIWNDYKRQHAVTGTPPASRRSRTSSDRTISTIGSPIYEPLHTADVVHNPQG